MESKYYNPDQNASDASFPDAVQKAIEDHEDTELETKDVAEQFGDNNHTFSDTTAKSKLYYAREHIEETTEVKTKRRKGGSSGQDTIIWRVVGE